MKNLIIIALTLLPLLLKSQSAIPTEKMVILLDSIVKADSIETIEIYAYKNYDNYIREEAKGTYQIIKFNGQFIVLSGMGKNAQYFNLDKLINFYVYKGKKERKMMMYFQFL